MEKGIKEIKELIEDINVLAGYYNIWLKKWG